MDNYKTQKCIDTKKQSLLQKEQNETLPSPLEGEGCFQLESVGSKVRKQGEGYNQRVGSSEDKRASNLHEKILFPSKKIAFTLTEVLITLGIIAVVAALTLPGLIYNYQKKTWVEGLKVGVSMLEQGFKMALADDGVDKLQDTQLWIKCADGSENWTYNSSDWKNQCAPELSKYFKGIKFESVSDMWAQGDTTNIMTDTAMCKKLAGKTNKWYYLNDKSKCRGWKNVAVTFANGMRADMGVGDDLGYAAGFITALDVNGGKGPNTWGRDVFYLIILPDGRVVGEFSRALAVAVAKYSNTEDFETKYNRYKTSRESACSKTTTEDGSVCSGRVIDEGWVMNY